MKSKKILLTATSLLTIAPAIASVASCSNSLNSSKKLNTVTFEDTNFVYEVISGTDARLTKWKTSKPSGSITIPDTVTSSGTTYTITEIGSRAFESCSSLTGVKIGKNITKIDTYAFYYCKNLVTLDFTGNYVLTEIGDYAFRDCKNLLKGVSAGLTMPSSIVTIGSAAFENCANITLLNTVDGLPNLITLGDCAFRNCTALTAIGKITNIESIGVRAFGGCTSLTKVLYKSQQINFTLPTTVKFIGLGAFTNTSLASGSGIYFSEKIYWSTKGNKEDTNAYKPDTTADQSSFFVNSTSKYAMTSLTKYTPITGITLSVGSESEFVVSDTPKLVATITPENATCKTVAFSSDHPDDVTIDSDGTIHFSKEDISPKFTATANDGSGISGSLTLSVISPIASFVWTANPTICFLNKTAQFSAEITIKPGVSEEYKQITYSVDDPEGTGATIDQDGLLTAGSKAGNITVKATATKVPTKVLTQEVSVGTTLNIDANGKCSGFLASALADVDNTIKVEFPDGVLKFPSYVKSIAEGGVFSNFGGTKLPDCITTLDFSEANEITEIPAYTFSTSGTKCLTGELTLPDSLTTVGERAFMHQKITKVKFPSTLATIGEGIFMDASYLTEVYFNPDCPLETITTNSFMNCTSLTSFNIPKHVNKIEQNALYDCNSMNNGTVKFENTSTDWKWGENNTVISVSNETEMATFFYTHKSEAYTMSRFVPPTEEEGYVIEVPTEPEEPATLQWDGTTEITDLSIPLYIEDTNGVHHDITYPSRPNYDGAFEGCESLVNITFPTSLEDLTTGGSETFAYCTNLKTVNLENIKTINSYHTFQGCSSLETIDLSSLVSISNVGCFEYCTSLESVTFGPNLQSLSSWMFNGCTALKSIDLSMCTNFGSWSTALTQGVFYNCTGCTNLKLPPNIYTLFSGGGGDDTNQQFTNLGKDTDGCTVEFPGSGTYVLGSDTDTRTTFAGANVTTIKCISSSIYNATDKLGGLLTHTTKLIVPHGTSFASTSVFSGWTCTEEGTEWDTWEEL